MRKSESCRAGGATGKKLDRLLSEREIVHQIIPIKEETRETLLIKFAGSGDSNHTVMPGPKLATEEIDKCLVTLKNLRPLPRYLIASGTLPPGVDEGFHAKLAEFASAHEIRLILYTSEVSLASALNEGVYLVRCNRHEYRDLTGEGLAEDEATQRQQLRALFTRGGTQILIATLSS